MRISDREAGSAIIILFVAVALFGAISYAISRGTEGGIKTIEGVRDDAMVTKSQGCTNAINSAQRRLEVRGCGSIISTLADGSNPNPDAPQDGSCSIYHTNGGGVSASCGTEIAASGFNPPLTMAIGDIYQDVIYGGTFGGKRLFTKLTDQGIHPWDNGSCNNTSAAAYSHTDGLANTDAILGTADSCAPYKSALACRALGPEWYLPARNELLFLFDSETIGAFSNSYQSMTEYWSSTLGNSHVAYARYFNSIYSYAESAPFLNAQLGIRCVRSD
jgi:hypothetical protein